MRPTELTVELTEISASVSFIEKTLQRFRLNRHDLMEALLISEEILHLMEKHAPASTQVQITITNQRGVPRIRLVALGSEISLREQARDIVSKQLDEESEEVIRGIFLNSYADSIKYRHSRSKNIVTIITGIPERILTINTILALIGAFIIGTAMRLVLPGTWIQLLLNNFFEPVETLFISGLMFIAAPTIFASITCSVFRFNGISGLGKGGKIIGVSYFATAVIAAVVCTLLFQLVQPGAAGILPVQGTVGGGGGFSLVDTLARLIPPNIVEPFLEMNSLQLMIMALIIGFIISLCGNRVTGLKMLMEEVDVLCGKIASIVMRCVPFVLFCSTVSVILSSHLELFIAIGELLAVILLALVCMVLVYCIFVAAVVRLNPFTYLRKCLPAMKSAFMKGSGVAAIPTTMRICKRKLGISEKIYSFVIPMGAAINMDGNCVCLIAISLFFGRVCDVSLQGGALVMFFILVLILSLGAPIAPGTLILCTANLLNQMGIPLDAIAPIIGINFILEMLLGMINSAGDIMVALMVAKKERELDLNIYNRQTK